MLLHRCRDDQPPPPPLRCCRPLRCFTLPRRFAILATKDTEEALEILWRADNAQYRHALDRPERQTTLRARRRRRSSASCCLKRYLYLVLLSGWFVSVAEGCKLDKLVEMLRELLCSIFVEVIIFHLIYSTIRCRAWVVYWLAYGFRYYKV
jgi:hypothetical protein